MNALFHLVAFELRQRRWPILLWTVSLAGMAALTLSVYSSIQGDSAQLSSALNNIPSTVKNLFSDTGDLVSPVGYLNSKLYYLMYPLLFSILGIGLASSMLGREEQSHTLELLLARPVSRAAILASKALAGLCILVVVASASLLVTIAYAAGLDIPISILNLSGAMLMAFLIGLFFSTITFMLAAIGYGAKAASVGISALFGLGSYLVVSLGQQVGWLDPLKHFIPYHYYRPTDILKGHFTTTEALGFVGCIAVMGIVSWLVFRRRDIE